MHLGPPKNLPLPHALARRTEKVLVGIHRPNDCLPIYLFKAPYELLPKDSVRAAKCEAPSSNEQ